MELFKLFGTIAVNNDEANRNIDETTNLAEGAGTRMISAFQKIGAAVSAAFAVDKIIDFGKSITDAAATVSAEKSAFSQIMGDYSDTAQEKVNQIADATGMVSSRLTPYMTSMTAKFKGLGYGVDEASDLASSGLTLAADAAAFWDKSLDDSMSALNSFINGSYEGGEAIGLFANDTQMGAYAIEQGIAADTKAWSSLDEATKQATRLEYAQAMFDMSGATGQAAKESDQYANVQANLSEKWRQFKSEIGEPVLQNLVIPAMTKLSEIVDKLSPAFQTLQSWVKEHKDTLTLLAGVVATVTAAILAYNVAMGAMSIVKTITTAINGMSIAQAALNAVMSANPIGIIVAAIAGLVTAFVLLWNKCDAFREFWINLWDAIKTIVTTVVNAVKEKVTSVWNAIKTTTTTVFNAIKTFFTTVWNAIKTTVTNVINSIKEKVANVFDSIKTAISTPLNAAKETVSTIFGNIKDKIKDTIEGARDIVKNAIDKIKDFFNFEWSLPKIKLPHFEITGEFSLDPPSIPHFSIDWYAKGGILKQPTLFDFDPATGRAKGGGEAGNEAIAPIDTLLDYVRTAVQEETSGMAYYLEKLVSMLASYFPEILEKMNREMVLDTGVLVGRIAPKMDSKLGDISKLRKRGG